MVLPDSYGISRAPYYSGRCHTQSRMFRLPGSHRLRQAFPDLSPTPRDFSLRTRRIDPVRTLPQPHDCNPYPVSHSRGLASSAFARHYSRNHMLFSLPVGTEMFHFPTFPPHTLYIQVRVTSDEAGRVSPFGHPRITVWLSTPRGLSQIPTSFFGSSCQGIHRALLKT